MVRIRWVRFVSGGTFCGKEIETMAWTKKLKTGNRVWVWAWDDQKQESVPTEITFVCFDRGSIDYELSGRSVRVIGTWNIYESEEDMKREFAHANGYGKYKGEVYKGYVKKRKKKKSKGRGN